MSSLRFAVTDAAAEGESVAPATKAVKDADNDMHLDIADAVVEAFDAKTPLPAAWALDPLQLGDSLKALSASEQQGIRRLQAIGRGFLARRTLRKLGNGPKQSVSPYVPTPSAVVEQALRHLQLDANSFLLDLGCGDGRVCCLASEEFGCRSVGVDQKRTCVAKARENVTALRQRDASKADLVQIVEGDFLHPEIRKLLGEVTVVWMFLLPKVQSELAVPIVENLQAGALLVCYAFKLVLPDWLGISWKPERQLKLEGSFFLPDQMSTLRLYRVTSELKMAVCAAAAARRGSSKNLLS